jgi:hypothetical protein
MEPSMMLFRFAKPSLAVDQPISLLESGERCVLAAMRLYVARIRNPHAELPGWWECFASLPAAAIAAHGFEAIMQLIGTTAKIRLDVRCIACPALGDGEIRLLNIVARAQAGNVDVVETALGEILPQAAARCASRIVVAFAGELARGGLVLPVRSGPASQEPAPTHACPDRGAGLVH